MSEFLIPEYWLTGLGSWAVSYLLHSSVILAGILVLTHYVGFFSESNKDVLLKIGLVAGIFTASLQFVQSSNGIAVNTMVMPLQELQSIRSNEVGRILSSGSLQVLVPQLPESPIRASEQHQVDWLKILLLCWLSGSVLFATRFVWLWRRFNRQTGQRKSLTHVPTIELCEKLRREMSIKRQVVLTSSEKISSPMAIGLSQICIPQGLWELVDEEQFTAILAHELAHLARTDPLWLFFWHLMSIIFFFQPLNKLTQLSFQSRAEFLADATAVRLTKDPVAMVNSLVSTAKLVNASIRGNMASQLLGNNANIVARSHLLLQENPLKTKTPLPFIIFGAALIVLASTYWLPSVSLSTPNVIDDMPKYGELNSQNAKAWTELSGTRLDFASNIDYSQSIAGKGQLMRTRLVTFNYDLDGIAAIAPFGQLRFASQSIYSNRSLVIEADFQGKLWYQYRVDGELIDSQLQARQFIATMLDDNFAQNDEFKRKMMRLYSAQGMENTTEQTMARFRFLGENPPSELTEKDRDIVKAIAQRVEVFTLQERFDPAADLRFFNAMAHYGDNMASFNDFGYLAISSKTKKPGSLSVQYNLNNRALLNLFAEASGESYQAGISEKALVHFLVRLHFKAREPDIIWLEE